MSKQMVRRLAWAALAVVFVGITTFALFLLMAWFAIAANDLIVATEMVAFATVVCAAVSFRRAFL